MRNNWKLKRIVSRVGAIVLIVLMTACAGQPVSVPVVTMSKLPEPTEEIVPDIPLFKSPVPIAWTHEDLVDIVEACELYKEISELGERNDSVDAAEARTSGWTKNEVFDEYGLSEESSCGFLVYALPDDDWGYMEFVIYTYSIGLEQRANTIRSLNSRARKRHKATKEGYDKTMEDLKDIGTIKEKQGFWDKLL
jgi:hypothetical protein